MAKVFKYTKIEPTVELIEQLTGKKVKSLKKGHIVVGTEQSTDLDGNPGTSFITERGIEVEFETDATTNDLRTLDDEMIKIGLKR